jgi:sec-independent protein translocase protein TatA
MSVGPAEILVILIVALLVFGPQRLPEVGRQVGAAVRELRKMQDAVRGELDMVLHPEHGTRPPDAPFEPGDHTTSPGELTSGEGPDSPAEIEPAGGEASDAFPDWEPGDTSDGSSSNGQASDIEHRFLGPPDSFI